MIETTIAILVLLLLALGFWVGRLATLKRAKEEAEEIAVREHGLLMYQYRQIVNGATHDLAEGLRCKIKSSDREDKEELLKWLDEVLNVLTL